MDPVRVDILPFQSKVLNELLHISPKPIFYHTATSKYFMPKFFDCSILDYTDKDAEYRQVNVAHGSSIHIVLGSTPLS